MLAPALALWQATTDPVGPAGWTLRNWLGLSCQVVVFVLLVAFIFWLADLGDRDEAAPGAGAGPSPDAPAKPNGEPPAELSAPPPAPPAPTA